MGRRAAAALRVSPGARVDGEPGARLGLHAVAHMGRGPGGRGATGQEDRGAGVGAVSSRRGRSSLHTWLLVNRFPILPVSSSTSGKTDNIADVFRRGACQP